MDFRVTSFRDFEKVLIGVSPDSTLQGFMDK